jgi:hypothetical protein
VWKLLGGAEVGLDDLIEVDANFVKQLKEISTTTDDVGYWGLTFEVTMSDGKRKALVPGGDDLDITMENRAQFVQLASSQWPACVQA